jgi:RNA polymerase sigma-70 factor (ECF subfamily)
MHTEAAAMVTCLNPTPLCEPVDWVDQHGDYLYRYALGQLRDKTDAEDLVQETFLAALEARARFHGQSSERTWLVSILRHKICDHFRRRYREPAAPAPSPTDGSDRFDQTMLWVHEVAAECVLPSRRLDLKDFRQSLETALHALPPRIAQAFTMYEMEECPSAEVCRHLDISEANLWTMVHRARKQLRVLLSGWRNEIDNTSRPC